jgi:hypothetical protein
MVHVHLADHSIYVTIEEYKLTRETRPPAGALTVRLALKRMHRELGRPQQAALVRQLLRARNLAGEGDDQRRAGSASQGHAEAVPQPLGVSVPHRRRKTGFITIRAPVELESQSNTAGWRPGEKVCKSSRTPA